MREQAGLRRQPARQPAAPPAAPSRAAIDWCQNCSREIFDGRRYQVCCTVSDAAIEKRCLCPACSIHWATHEAPRPCDGSVRVGGDRVSRAYRAARSSSQPPRPRPQQRRRPAGSSAALAPLSDVSGDAAPASASTSDADSSGEERGRAPERRAPRARPSRGQSQPCQATADDVRAAEQQADRNRRLRAVRARDALDEQLSNALSRAQQAFRQELLAGVLEDMRQRGDMRQRRRSISSSPLRGRGNARVGAGRSGSCSPPHYRRSAEAGAPTPSTTLPPPRCRLESDDDDADSTSPTRLDVAPAPASASAPAASTSAAAAVPPRPPSAVEAGAEAGSARVMVPSSAGAAAVGPLLLEAGLQRAGSEPPPLGAGAGGEGAGGEGGGGEGGGGAEVGAEEVGAEEEGAEEAAEEGSPPPPPAPGPAPTTPQLVPAGGDLSSGEIRAVFCGISGALQHMDRRLASTPAPSSCASSSCSASSSLPSGASSANTAVASAPAAAPPPGPTASAEEVRAWLASRPELVALAATRDPKSHVAPIACLGTCRRTCWRRLTSWTAPSSATSRYWEGGWGAAYPHLGCISAVNTHVVGWRFRGGPPEVQGEGHLQGAACCRRREHAAGLRGCLRRAASRLARDCERRRLPRVACLIRGTLLSVVYCRCVCALLSVRRERGAAPEIVGWCIPVVLLGRPPC